MRLSRSALVAIACITAAPVFAQGKPATCSRDLFQNEAGLRQQQTRLTGVANGDMPTQCRAYRDYVGFLQKSRAVFATCQSGREREQNVGQMDSELADYRALIASRCGR